MSFALAIEDCGGSIEGALQSLDSVAKGLNQ